MISGYFAPTRAKYFDIGVNAAGVAGVVTPQYLTCRGRPVLTTPNILASVLFFSIGHMNLKNNTHRMHHITPFWDEKLINFLGRGSPSTDPTPSPPTAPRFSRLRRSTCDPQCSSGVDAHVFRSPRAYVCLYVCMSVYYTTVRSRSSKAYVQTSENLMYTSSTAVALISADDNAMHFWLSRMDHIIIIIIIIYLRSMQKWTVKYAMCRTERLTVLAQTTARRYRIVTIKTQL